MPSRRVRAALIAAATIASSAQFSRALIFYSTPDPTFNNSAPTGTLANSGWQWEASWRNSFLATPISTHAFIGAHHIDQSENAVGSAWNFNGVDYTITADINIPGTDLNVYTVDGTFPTYPLIWDTSLDGTEQNKTAVMIGRGTDRG